MDLIKNGKVLSRLTKFSSYNCYDFCLKCRTAGVNKLSFDWAQRPKKYFHYASTIQILVLTWGQEHPAALLKATMMLMRYIYFLKMLLLMTRYNITQT